MYSGGSVLYSGGSVLYSGGSVLSLRSFIKFLRESSLNKE